MNVNTYLSGEEQRKLAAAKVGVAGIGGLGSNVLAHLVRAGVERFVAVDFDVVSVSNLNRQFFFADQLGMPKTAAIAENLRRINPDVQLELHDARITPENAAALFADCDCVVEAFDNAAAKTMLINEMLRVGKPVIAASGLAGFGKSNAIRLRKVGKLLYVAGDLDSAISATLAPASPRVGIAASMQANTVIALLLGLEI